MVIFCSMIFAEHHYNWLAPLRLVRTTGTFMRLHVVFNRSIVGAVVRTIQYGTKQYPVHHAKHCRQLPPSM